MRHRERPLQLTSASFAEALDRTPYVLVRVGPGTPGFHDGVAEFFARQYQGLFTFGVLGSRQTRAHGWWERNFQSAAGPVRTPARDGYWLFHAGVVIGHHSGSMDRWIDYREPRDHAGDAHARAHAEVEWVREVAFGTRPVGPEVLLTAYELIAYFDGRVSQQQDRAGYGGGRERRGRPIDGFSDTIEAQEVPIPGASGDPYQVLGVQPGIDDDALRRAYRERMKRNHPDKVSHMSVEIQAYAHAQVRVIRAAYEAIMAYRRG